MSDREDRKLAEIVEKLHERVVYLEQQFKQHVETTSKLCDVVEKTARQISKIIKTIQ